MPGQNGTDLTNGSGGLAPGKLDPADAPSAASLTSAVDEAPEGAPQAPQAGLEDDAMPQTDSSTLDRVLHSRTFQIGAPLVAAATAGYIAHRRTDGEITRKVGEGARRAAHRAGEAVNEGLHHASERARAAGERAGERLSRTAAAVGTTVGNAAVSSVTGVKNATTGAARRAGQGTAAAAERTSRVARELGEAAARGTEDLGHEAVETVRRNPVTAACVTFVAGIVTGALIPWNRIKNQEFQRALEAGREAAALGLQQLGGAVVHRLIDQGVIPDAPPQSASRASSSEDGQTAKKTNGSSRKKSTRRSTKRASD